MWHRGSNVANMGSNVAIQDERWERYWKKDVPENKR
jgi:hypothetical protein